MPYLMGFLVFEFILVGVPLLNRKTLMSQAIPVQTTSAILAQLPGKANAIREWQQLEDRYRTGKLTADQIDQAIGILIADLKNKTPKLRGVTYFARHFVEMVLEDQVLNPTTQSQLIHIFYASGPSQFVPIKTSDPDHWSGVKVRFAHHYPIGANWDTRPHCQLISVTAESDPQTMLPIITANRQPAKTQPTDTLDALAVTFDQGGKFYVANVLEPGEHVLIFTFRLCIYPTVGARDKPTVHDIPLLTQLTVHHVPVTVANNGQIQFTILDLTDQGQGLWAQTQSVQSGSQSQ